jgi:hypothetical protein
MSYPAVQSTPTDVTATAKSNRPFPGMGAREDHDWPLKDKTLRIANPPIWFPPKTKYLFVATRQQYPPVKKNPGVAGE